MTERHIDILVTGHTDIRLVKFQPSSEPGRELLKRSYGTRLDKQGALWVSDSESDSIFNLLDDAGLWTETRG